MFRTRYVRGAVGAAVLRHGARTAAPDGALADTVSVGYYALRYGS